MDKDKFVPGLPWLDNLLDFINGSQLPQSAFGGKPSSSEIRYKRTRKRKTKITRMSRKRNR